MIDGLLAGLLTWLALSASPRHRGPVTMLTGHLTWTVVSPDDGTLPYRRLVVEVR